MPRDVFAFVLEYCHIVHYLGTIKQSSWLTDTSTAMASATLQSSAVYISIFQTTNNYMSWPFAAMLFYSLFTLHGFNLLFFPSYDCTLFYKVLLTVIFHIRSLLPFLIQPFCKLFYSQYAHRGRNTWHFPLIKSDNSRIIYVYQDNLIQVQENSRIFFFVLQAKFIW